MTRSVNGFAVARLAFGLLAVAAFGLGYLGLARYFAHADAELSHRVADLFYYDLQLFVLGSEPLDSPGPYPLPLNIARFLAPVATAYAIFETARVIVAREYRRWQLGLVKNHVVVCGESLVAQAVAAREQAAGAVVVLVRADGVAQPGTRVVTGDPGDPRVLAAAGVAGAAKLYAVATQTSNNLAIALAASSVARGSDAALTIQVLTPDPQLCLALRARRLALPDPPRQRLDFFSVDEVAARHLADTDAAELSARAAARPGHPHVLIVGASAFGRTLLVELARRWRFQTDHTHLITLLDPQASAAVADLRRRNPFLRDCVIRAYDVDAELARWCAENPLRPAPTRTYLCYPDEARAISAAITAVHLWRGVGSVVVRLDRLAAFSEALAQARGLLEPAGGALRPWGVLDVGTDPQLISDDLVEQLARAIHDRYLAARLHEGERLGSRPSLVEWARLTPELQDSNRSQANDIGRKLQSVSAMLVPLIDPAIDVAFTDDEIERLARLEHERWVTFHRQRGWRLGDTVDPAARTNPDLVDWSDLSEPVRDKDRETIRNLPGLLAEVGFQIVRSAGETAP